MNLNLMSKLKRLALLIVFILSFQGIKSEIIKALSISINDGTEEFIPLYEDVTLEPNENNLHIKFYNGEIEISLISICQFKLCEIEMDFPSNDDPNQDAGIKPIQHPNNSEWVIFSIDGIEIDRGNGIIDYSSLKNGRIYIIKQGSIQYKFIMK